MKTKEILTRDNEPTVEFCKIKKKTYKSIELLFEETHYLDYEVNEDTGMINKDKKVKHYTKDQVIQNLKNLKNENDKCNLC